MPQMMPLPWLIIMLITSMILIMTMSKIYFSPYFSTSKFSQSTSKKSLNWLW